jgi:hypothetical protein
LRERGGDGIGVARRQGHQRRYRGAELEEGAAADAVFCQAMLQRIVVFHHVTSVVG